MQSAHNLFRTKKFLPARTCREIACFLLIGRSRSRYDDGEDRRSIAKQRRGGYRADGAHGQWRRQGWATAPPPVDGRPPPDPSFLEQACPSFSHVFAADVTHLWLVGSALHLSLYMISHVSPCCKHFALYLIPNHRWFVCQYSLIVSRQSPTPRSAARGRSSSALRPRSLSNSSSRCSNTVSFLTNLPFMFGIGIERNWRRPVEAAAVVFSPDVDRPRNIFGTAPDGKIGRSCRLRTQRGESGGTSWPRPCRMSAHRT